MKGRAIVVDKPLGKFRTAEVDVPQPKDGEVLIRQEACGVCGTDMHIYQGHFPGAKFPTVLGHEIIGTIEKLGEDVKQDFTGRPVKEGDRIYVIPGLQCGRCYFCSVIKEPTLCINPRRTAYGFTPFPDQMPSFQGGYADYLYVNHPFSKFVKLNLPPEVGVLLEPLTVGVHMVERAKLHVGCTVVIQGSGAIGLAGLVVAREAGAIKTIVVGAPQTRLDLAKKLGADEVVNIEQVPDPAERISLVKGLTEKEWGADAVFECTGSPKAIPEGIDMLRRGGTYVVAGHFTDVGEVSINPYLHLNNKHITLVGVWGSSPAHFVYGRTIMESKTDLFKGMVSHRLPLERIGDAMKSLMTDYRLDGTEVRKIVIASRVQ